MALIFASPIPARILSSFLQIFRFMYLEAKTEFTTRPLCSCMSLICFCFARVRQTLQNFNCLLRCHNICHFFIVLFGFKCRKQLESIAESHRHMVRFCRKKAVIIPRPITVAVSVLGKPHARRDHQRFRRICLLTSRPPVPGCHMPPPQRLRSVT